MPLIKYPRTPKSNSDNALVNPYFQYGQSLANFNELSTYRSIISECIQIHGYSVTVIRRDHKKFDRIWIEDPSSEFTRSFTIEMMLINGDLDAPNPLMTRFGIQFDQDLTFAVSYDRWSAMWMAQADPNSKDVLIPQQPNQGDLLILNVGFPDSRGATIGNADDYAPYVYEILFSDGNPFRMGGTQWYVLTCKLFDYSAEMVDVGENEMAYEQSYLDKWNPHRNNTGSTETINATLDKAIFGDDGNVQEPIDNLHPDGNVQETNWQSRNHDIEIIGTDVVIDPDFQKGKAKIDDVEIPNTVDGDTLLGDDW